MNWRTLLEWNKKGRSVLKGEKALLFEPKTGLALFSKDQTKKLKSKTNGHSDNCLSGGVDYDYDDSFTNESSSFVDLGSR